MAVLEGACCMVPEASRGDRDYMFALLVFCAAVGVIEIMKAAAEITKQVASWATTRQPPLPPPLQVWISPHGDKFHRTEHCGGLRRAGAVEAKTACLLCSK